MPIYPLQIFYDGACKMCAGQMEKFQKKDVHKRLIFMDISEPGFEAKKFGLDGELLLKYIYAKDASGRIVRGIDAFIWMWRAVDNNLPAFLVGLPGIKQLGKVVYRIISRSRYFFGKRENVCDFHCAKEL